MKIEMELKPGDIVLLKLLACILIAFFSFRFLIFPGIEKNQEMEITRQSLEEEQEEMQFTINNAPTVETMIEKQKDTLKEKSTAYQPLMENREVDELVGKVGQVIARGINLALQPRLTEEEIELLTHDSL